MKQKLKLWMIAAVMLLHVWMPVSELNAATDPQYFEFDAATGTIVNYDPSGPKDLVIPEQIDGVAVQAIGRAAFAYRELNSVVIPDSVKTIGDGAFLLNQLAEIVIPPSVQTIGAHAFSMNRLRQLTLPDSVVEMGENAFMMNGLTKLTLSRSLSRIAKGAFVFNKLSEVQIPDAVTEIEESAFSLNDLTSVVLPDSVTRIGPAAFYGSQLTEIMIPDSVTVIDWSAFRSNQLKRVVIPDSVTQIGQSAFEENQLTEVVIPDSVAVINWTAFGSNLLTDVSVGHHCLCEGAFDPDVSVARREPTASSFLPPLSIEFSGTVREVSEADLAYVISAAIRNPNSATAQHVRVYADLPTRASLTEGNPLVSLGDLEAGESRDIAWELLLPKEGLYESGIFSLSAAGDNFASSSQEFYFGYATGYEEITEGDYTFDKTMGMILSYSESGPKDVVIPNQIAGKTVTGIGSRAFSDKSLTSVSLPDSLVFIGYDAFSGNQLTRVELPNSLRILVQFCFRNNQLAEVILPESLSEIPYGAFYNNQLTAITIPDSVIYIENEAFLDNPLTSVLLPPQCLINGTGVFNGSVQVKRR